MFFIALGSSGGVAGKDGAPVIVGGGIEIVDDSSGVDGLEISKGSISDASRSSWFEIAEEGRKMTESALVVGVDFDIGAVVSSNRERLPVWGDSKSISSSTSMSSYAGKSSASLWM